MKYLLPLLLLLCGLFVSCPAFVSAQQNSVPSAPSLFYCVGNNPQPPCVTIPPSPSVSQSQPISPSTTSASPSTSTTAQPSQSVTSPSPSPAPVSPQPPAAPKKHATPRGGLLQQFMQFLIQLFQLLFQLLGGQIPTPTPVTTSPSSTPSLGVSNSPSSGAPSSGGNNTPSSGAPSSGGNNTPSSGAPSSGGNNTPSSGTPSSGSTACSGSSTVTVPTVVYDSISAAESALTKAGLKYTLNNNSGKNTGVIFSQTPAGGTKNVKCGSNVDIASSPATVTVPNVIKDSVIAAENALRGQGLKYTLNSSKGNGPIDSQTPKSGTKVNSGTNVDIDASASTSTSNACTVAGGKCITSTQATTDSKTMTVTHIGGSDDTACAVITAGTGCYKEIAKTTTTTKVTVPKVVGNSVANAEEALTSIGLTYKLNSSKGTGPIDSQTPASGASVAKGSNVDIDASATGTATSNACTAAGGNCEAPATATADQKAGAIVTHLGGSDDTSCSGYPTNLCYKDSSTGSSSAGNASVFSQAVDAVGAVWNVITSPIVQLLTSL